MDAREHGAGEAPAWDLVAVAMAAGLGLAVALIGLPGWIAVPLAAPLFLYAPGYAVLAALRPRGRAPDVEERIRCLLPLGLSASLVVVLGVILGRRPAGHGLATTGGALAVGTIALAWVASRRGHRAPAWRPPDPRKTWPTAPRRTRLAALALGLAATLFIGSLGYALLAPPPRETFIEFGVLRSDGSLVRGPITTAPNQHLSLRAFGTVHGVDNAMYVFTVDLQADGTETATRVDHDIGLARDGTLVTWEILLLTPPPGNYTVAFRLVTSSRALEPAELSVPLRAA